MRIQILIVLLNILFVWNCAGPKKVTPDLSKVTYRQLLENNARWQQSISSLKGDARISLDSPKYSGNFNTEILLTGHDSLLINVKGPLGVEVGRVFVGRDRFIFYNQMENQFLTGTTDEFVGKNFLQFPVDISQLRSVFLAQDQFNVLKKERFTIKDNQYYLEAHNASRQFNIWFDPRYLLISRIEYREDNELIYYKVYDRFTEFNAIPFPRSVNFVRPYEQQGISIYFNDLEINRPIDSDEFNINISDNAKQIDLSLQNQN